MKNKDFVSLFVIHDFGQVSNKVGNHLFRLSACCFGYRTLLLILRAEIETEGRYVLLNGI
jgi:hypothetical protein